MPLPKLPAVTVELLEQLASHEPGFLQLSRQRLRLRYEDGSVSEPFVYDTVERAALDAVVIVAHYLDAQRRRCVYLRSAIRPPIATRPQRIAAARSANGCDHPATAMLWEVPAGLVEPDEEGDAGVRRCAARELWEELGFRAPESAFGPLGPPLFGEPGTIGERHYYLEVIVAPEHRQVPAEDGSVLEQRAVVAAIPLTEALALIAAGAIEDAKSELALRRLADRS